MEVLSIVIAVLVPIYSYLLGSISTAILVSKGLYHQDIREYGSGNAGMTNALRVYGKKAAILTTVGDLGKGAVAVVLTGLLYHYVLGFGVETVTYLTARCVSAFCVILGHIWPIYFHFQGGKGVLTTVGVWMFVDWRVALFSFAMFGVVVLLTKYVSLGSIVGMLTFIVSTLTWGLLGSYASIWPPLVISVVVATICIAMHRKNIQRLINGTESKLGHHSKEKAEDAPEK